MALIIEYGIDNKSALKALAEINAASASNEKQFGTSYDAISKKVELVSKTLLSYADKEVQATERKIKSLEALAVASGKTGEEKLIAKRDALIKSLGDNEKAIQRVTTAYEQLLKAESSGSGSENKFKSFGESIKQFIENPMQGAGKASEGLLEKIGPLGIGLGTVAGVAVAVGAAIIESAKSLGEYALQVRDVELRTGLTAQQFAQFSFAAKAVGADISIVERGMRGLTMAVEDESQKGEKAREVLRGYGIDIAAVKDGTASTSDVFMKISEALEHNTNTFGRNKDMIDLFKRAGLDLIPFLTELKENTKYFEEHGLPSPKDPELEKWRQYNKEITAAEAKYESFKRSVEGGIVEHFFGAPGQMSGHNVGLPGLTGIGSGYPGQVYFGSQTMNARPQAPGVPTPESLLKDFNQRIENIADQTRLGQYGGTKEGLEAQLQEAKKAETAAVSGMHKNILNSSNAYDEARKNVVRLTEAIKDLDNANKGVFVAHFGQDPYDMAAGKVRNPYGVASAAGTGRVPSLQGSTFQVSEADIESANKGMTNAQGRINKAYAEGSLQNMKQQDEEHERVQKAILGYQEEMIKLQAGPGGEFETAKKIFDLRLQSAKSSTDAQILIIDLQKQLNEIQSAADVAHNAALKKQAEEQQKMLEAEHQQVQTFASGVFNDLTGKHPAQSLAKQLHDTGMKAASTQFGSTIADLLVPGGNKEANAAAKRQLELDTNTKATDNNTAATIVLAQVMAQRMGFSLPTGSISPTGVNVPTLSAGAGSSSTVTSGNGAGVFSVGSTAVPASSLGIPSFGGGVPSSSIGGFSIPGLSGAPGGTTGFNGPVSFGGGSGTRSSSSPFNLSSIFGKGGGFSNLGKQFGIGQSQGSVYGPTDEQLGAPGDGGVGGDTDTGDIGGGTSFSSVLGSAGVGNLAGGLGMGLLANGLTGKNEGTWKGTFEDTLGGAGIGLKYGGPIGAAIGAAAGFAAGGIEQLLGVMSPANKAKKQVKQDYGVSINDVTANKIARLAQQSYGGNISLAVHSAQVRQMIGVYAAGTGQNGNGAMSSLTPHAAGLTETSGSGGAQLSQTAEYMYGKAYSFNSGIPVANGIQTGGNTITTPSNYSGAQPAPTNVSLNIASQGAADFIQGNVVNSDYVSATYADAQMGSNGRLDSSALMNDPGLGIDL